MIPNENQHIFTISELNRGARQLLESHFDQILVEGEISNLTQHSSGHWYFTLKDKKAQIRCAMFSGSKCKVKFQPEIGMHVLARARMSLYEARGDYQLIVESLDEMGFGALQRAFEQLKEKLSKEGLFDEDHKKPIPEMPSCLGVVTSPTGAAIRDITSVLKRRFPLLPIIIYPTLVQGDEAAKQIVAAIIQANQQKRCDVLLVSRGGGSLEDLWPFNEEIVARAIFESALPIVTGIGHEIDFTIADFVSDLRTPTPSAAAEVISPDSEDILRKISIYYKQLKDKLHQLIEKRIVSFGALNKRLLLCDPRQQLLQQAQHLDRLTQDLVFAMKHIIETKDTRLDKLAKMLDMASPLSTLRRGYSVLSDEHGKTITKANSVKPGDIIKARLAKGSLICTTTQVLTSEEYLENKFLTEIAKDRMNEIDQAVEVDIDEL